MFVDDFNFPSPQSSTHVKVDPVPASAMSTNQRDLAAFLGPLTLLSGLGADDEMPSDLSVAPR